MKSLRCKYLGYNLGQSEPLAESLFVVTARRACQGSIKNWTGPCQRTPKQVGRDIRYSGLGVRSVGPVGDFLETYLEAGIQYLVSGFNPFEKE